MGMTKPTALPRNHAIIRPTDSLASEKELGAARDYLASELVYQASGQEYQVSALALACLIEVQGLVYPLSEMLEALECRPLAKLVELGFQL